jgi:hypothetical protein
VDKLRVRARARASETFPELRHQASLRHRVECSGGKPGCAAGDLPARPAPRWRVFWRPNVLRLVKRQAQVGAAHRGPSVLRRYPTLSSAQACPGRQLAGC